VSSFDRLHPAVQHHIVNSLGWQSLRPLQEQSIDHLLGGGNAILLAPTAGGKTEAAVFPLLSRMLTNNWQPVSIIYVCPLKALLNNLHDRLEQYCTHDRGWHMLYLFERLQTITGREIQRIGLSATVGNPQELCGWLVGANQGIAKVLRLS